VTREFAGEPMPRRAALAALLVIAVHAPLPAHAAGDPAIRSQTVQFAKGATSVQLRGTIKGDAGVDYKIDARAGQTLAVTMKPSNAASYFNINPPGSDVAMFIGSTSGQTATVMLPDDGVYVVRVYLMRSAARRNETSNYELTVGVTGKALAAVPAAKDALIPGTRFHASASVPCTPPFDPKPQQCEAFVIRRGFDGTATIEIRGPGSTLRRILFVAGAPVASDATEPLTHSRDGDRTVVKIGADERYELPDALIRGG
jgi:hypothetical protein